MSDPLLAAIFEWDIATWSQAVPVWERLVPTDLEGRRGLELGARNGGLSLYLARKGAVVTCSDLQDPRQRAEALHERWGVAPQIEYAAADAAALPFEDASFDLVAFKSVLGALSTADRQRQAVAEMHRVLRPDGWLLWAENLQATPLHRLLRRRLPWASYWRYPSLEDWRGWTAAFASCELRTAGVTAAFGRSERQRRQLARIDRGLQRLCPRSWHYVAFGVARR